ncbi:MAG: hypothetical protein A2X49_16015 [Lentisphaerae bacterium GWF2_52_8]|nr:MAG: hypothetical protein A2X49_16015 [Lentisphaerae bacterium GWF2_52_8]
MNRAIIVDTSLEPDRIARLQNFFPGHKRSVRVARTMSPRSALGSAIVAVHSILEVNIIGVSAAGTAWGRRSNGVGAFTNTNSSNKHEQQQSAD